ncbi:hypothetical protein Hypma_004133 [Hypsizygus marmoreus]|uniref:Uncharacterized protein n=1 Tax=Hypsizygus marmoreus TaxID=39966 RepID=A0A369J9M7_HYPMA|nr:hypothetical protein Hypma_004133 [Hypsizygus marmoreus]
MSRTPCPSITQYPVLASSLYLHFLQRARTNPSASSGHCSPATKLPFLLSFSSFNHTGLSALSLTRTALDTHPPIRDFTKRSLSTQRDRPAVPWVTSAWTPPFRGPRDCTFPSASPHLPSLAPTHTKLNPHSPQVDDLTCPISRASAGESSVHRPLIPSAFITFPSTTPLDALPSSHTLTASQSTEPGPTCHTTCVFLAGVSSSSSLL